jgi:hypothetical protein
LALPADTADPCSVAFFPPVLLHAARTTAKIAISAAAKALFLDLNMLGCLRLGDTGFWFLALLWLGRGAGA